MNIPIENRNTDIAKALKLNEDYIFTRDVDFIMKLDKKEFSFIFVSGLEIINNCYYACVLSVSSIRYVSESLKILHKGIIKLNDNYNTKLNLTYSVGDPLFFIDNGIVYIVPACVIVINHDLQRVCRYV